MLIEPVDAARAHVSSHVDPDDFDAFWADTLAEAARHDLDVRPRRWRPTSRSSTCRT